MLQSSGSSIFESRLSRRTGTSATQRVLALLSAALRPFYSIYRRMAAVLTRKGGPRTDLYQIAAHELRNPIAVARGYVDMVETGELGELTPAGNEALERVAERLNYMDDLVSRLVETARLEGGTQQLSMRDLDLGELTTQTVDRMLTDSHRLVTHLPDDPLMVVADPFRVGTVISNLIDNAIKYSPVGGEITCTVGRSDETCWVKVADQGVGIDPAEASGLFQPFGRLRRTARLGKPGTGLGLYLCRGIARAHGGDLVATPNPGGGSVFTLTLPT